MRGIRLWGALLFFIFNTQAFAADAPSCKTVRFSDPGWTDIAATTGIASTILTPLGYDIDVKMLSVAVTYSALSTGDIDVFLGYWHPTMEADLKPYADDGTVETVRINLEGAKYTLAVPQGLFDEGLQHFDDIARFSEALNFSIHGIEPGNDGNRTVLAMLEKNAYNLGNFNLIESSESAMLAEVEAKIAEKEAVVFLAWEPHPMNNRFSLAYLSGGEDFFGPNKGGAHVATNVRQGYGQECPNVGRLLENLSFTLKMENDMMGAILDYGVEPVDAARDWLQKNPDMLDVWLEGVTTFSGEEAALDVVKASLFQ